MIAIPSVAPFTPLRVRSHGSLLYGTASPAALVARALELGCRSLALADRDNLYLAIAFYRTALAEGLQPLIGCTLSDGTHEALLIAADRRGYANMCRLVSARQLEPRFDLAAALTAPSACPSVPAHAGPPAAGLHVVVESPGLAASLLAGGLDAAAGERGAGAAPGGSRRACGLWMGVRGLPHERLALGERIEGARRLRVPLVATADTLMLRPADHDTHRVAVTAAAGELLDRMPPSAFGAAEAWLASPPEWDRRVRAACAAAGRPEAAAEALAHNRALVERCRLAIDLGTPIFPRTPGDGREPGPARLLRLALAGLRERYGGVPHAARRRLDEELAMIERLGFTDYFLLVAEIVGFARTRGIATVGRGSGASSIVAYVLGITNVDPIRYGLAFERFLNPRRRDCPDLDIDLCWRRREEVIAHVYDTYGADRVATISTHATLGARSAFRETAKALGVSNARVNGLARRIPRELARPYLDHLAAYPEARTVDWREPVLARSLALAERLDGAPRHLSVHCGGIVIADRPLTHYVPLERAAKDVVVTQFEMRAIEAIGLVKMDLLGNRALSTIAECLTIERGRRDVDDDSHADVLARGADAIPHDDPATATRVAAGDTLNCFQLESPAMRHLLRMLDARTLDQAIAAVALVRPGPAESGMKEAFCRRQRGLEPAAFLHPRLEPVLGATHGVMLYEEDVMRVAAALAGLSLAEGDDLRRAIGAARDAEALRALERGFVMQSVRAGVARDTATAVWRDLARFGAYAFCKAHAAGYGALGWQCAFLKTHFPAAFAVGILNHHAGMYPTWVHVEDLRRQGVTFHAPCVRRSAWDATFEDGAVRVGLSRVHGLHEATGARVVAARRDGAYRSLADFVERVRPALPEVEALVAAGALDWTGRSRPSLLLEARAASGLRVRARAPVRAPVLVAPDGAVFDPAPRPAVSTPELPEFDLLDRVLGECETTGLWFSGHPLDLLAPATARGAAIDAASLPAHVGRRVAVAGMPCARRRVETKRGEPMLFVTIADRSGLAECVLFPDAYRAHASALRGRVLRIEGRADETLGAVALSVERVKVLA